MVSHSLWEAVWDGSDPGPAPLSGQVISWPVDPEENSVTNKEGQEPKKNGAKVGCQERTTTKFYLSCKNSDGRSRTLLLGQSGVSESQTSPKVPPFSGGKAAAVDTHLGKDAVVGKGLGWVCFSLTKGPQPSTEACPHVQGQAEEEEEVV